VLAERAKNGRLPRAIVSVDLYGQCADYERLEAASAEYEVPLLADAAEALGATYRDHQAGSFGKCAVFSFNGNKIITTGGGGMLVSNDKDLVDRARFLATQAREPAVHYEHKAIGYNYRLSNILAAIGRGQLELLEDRVAVRRANFEAYRDGLQDVPGISFMPEAAYGSATRWLTCILVDEEAFGAPPRDIVQALESENIEARPVWKPMHLQPVFASARVVGGQVAEKVFSRGVCLPSGSSLSSESRDRVVSIVRAQCRSR
jgi:pyridoxal phosphate-dependent aminotransferase EpsN